MTLKTFFTTAVLLLIASVAYAQEKADPNKPDSLLTKDEAESRIELWKGKVATLQADYDRINGQVTAKNTQLASLQTQLDDCNESIYALLGITESDVSNFRERLGRIETRTREMQRMSDEDLSKMMSEIDVLWNDLNTLRKEKPAMLPEFYDKIVSLAREIQQLRTRAQGFRGNTYTVGTWQKDRDCLWNIAAKDEIYNDPFMWPKIWQANTDKIRNPDLIYPGQVLRIPPAGPKTDEELRAERLYYRQKREAARRRATARRTQQVDDDGAGSGN